MADTAGHRPSSPDWDALFDVAQSQDGYFTTAQAAMAGYSPQLLAKYLDNGKVSRVRRGIYRLVHYPASEHEDLVVLWLWSGRTGVFSHETALFLHDLSDVLPSKVHLTLPEDWRRRRLRVPRGLVLHHAPVDDDEWQDHGAFVVTSPPRTLRDCLESHVRPDLVQQAMAEARRRGLISGAEEAAFGAAMDRATLETG
jgi:predicted transcriptional regulator of viral defense system